MPPAACSASISANEHSSEAHALNVDAHVYGIYLGPMTTDETDPDNKASTREDRQDLFRQWLAVHVVALMGVDLPVQTIAEWSKRRLLDNFDNPAPGRNQPRTYSFMNAVQLHGAWVATRQCGCPPAIAMRLGRACVHRYLERFDNGDPAVADEPWMSFVWWMQSGGITGRFMSTVEMAECLRKHEMLTFPTDIGSSGQVQVFDVDLLLHFIRARYVEVDKKFNALALAGKLKPFPKSLLRRSDDPAG